MCKAFFEFYPEPTRKTCRLVKKKWRRECNLRVDLIQWKYQEEWAKATLTQKLLDGVEPKATPSVNPYMEEYGDYSLTEFEMETVVASLLREESKEKRG